MVSIFVLLLLVSKKPKDGHRSLLRFKRSPPERPIASKIARGAAKSRPKSRQERPKSGPREAKSAPRRPKSAPEGHKTSQQLRKAPQSDKILPPNVPKKPKMNTEAF